MPTDYGDSTFTRVNAAAELAFGRNPVGVLYLTQQLNEPPEHGTSPLNLGEPIEDRVACQVTLTNTFRAGAISGLAMISGSNFTSGQTYNLVLGGTTFTTTGEASATAALTELATAINTAASADTDPRARVREFTFPVFGTFTALEFWAWGDTSTYPATPAAMTVDYSVSGSGSPSMTVMATTTDSHDLRVHLKPKSATGDSIAPPWVVPIGGDYAGIETGTLRVDVAGYERIAVQVTDYNVVAGHGASVVPLIVAWVAPCDPEE